MCNYAAKNIKKLKILIIPDYVYYNIVQFTLRYEYSTILFSPKT
jgi:hypothetical protein